MALLISYGALVPLVAIALLAIGIISFLVRASRREAREKKERDDLLRTSGGQM